MPFRTKYEIYNMRFKAPVHSGYDKTMAYVEWNEFVRNPKGEFFRMEQTPELVGDYTKTEEYLFLVYNVRRLIKRYYSQGRKHDDLVASLSQEKILDDWNARTAAYIANHPGYQPADAKSHSFYVLVSSWRKAWRERMGYRRIKDYDERVLDQMTSKCRQLEKKIDEYIKQNLQMI